ncbi:MAG: acyl-CoA reductase [Bacteroidales bacterium]|nr:acyl-CoA reductase [Bacteroidales bacterium]
MMKLKHRIQAFVALGEAIRTYLPGHNLQNKKPGFNYYHELIHQSIKKSIENNQWFIQQHILYALRAISNMLTFQNLDSWLEHYDLNSNQDKKPLEIGVINAGNIPAVGFHDFLTVLITGNKYAGKLSSDDPYLLPCFAEILINIDKKFSDLITFHPKIPLNADAVIATGSNNTARYFDFLYGSKPHIFRQNRNGIAILSGKETELQLINLTRDIFMHFGLGCRNVSKLYIPVGYDFKSLIKAFKTADYVLNHKPFMNNYRYQKALNSMQESGVIDNGFILLINSLLISSQPATLHYEFYDDNKSLKSLINNQNNEIQCISGLPSLHYKTIDFGKTQEPELSDYADGIDTIEFINSLKLNQ